MNLGLNSVHLSGARTSFALPTRCRTVDGCHCGDTVDTAVWVGCANQGHGHTTCSRTHTVTRGIVIVRPPGWRRCPAVLDHPESCLRNKNIGRMLSSPGNSCSDKDSVVGSGSIVCSPKKDNLSSRLVTSRFVYKLRRIGGGRVGGKNRVCEPKRLVECCRARVFVLHT